MERKRRAFLAGASSAVACALTGCLAGTNGNPTPNRDGNGESTTPLSLGTTYPQYQYDAANTGVVPDVSGPTGAISSFFTFSGADASSGYQMGAPSLTDQTLYLTEGSIDASDDAQTAVYALDATNGEVVWETTYSNTNAAGPTAVTDNNVLAEIGGSIAALDRTTGTERWTFTEGISSGITVDEETAYVVGMNSESATLYALSVLDGTVSWESEIDAETYLPTPAVVEDTVYVGGKALQALDTSDGTEQWRTETSVSTPPTVGEDRIVVGSENTLRVYDRDDGTEQWTTDIETFDVSEPSAVTSSPVVDDDVAYVVANGGLSAYDIEEEEKAYATELDIDGTPVIAGDYLYTVGPGQLVCLSTEDGTTEWSYGTERRADTGGVTPIVASDIAYFSTEQLYAIS